MSEELKKIAWKSENIANIHLLGNLDRKKNKAMSNMGFFQFILICPVALEKVSQHVENS